MNRLNIVIPIFVFQKTGGMRVLTKLAEEWCKQEYNVEIVVSDSSRPYFPVHSSIKVTNLNIKNKLKRVTGLSNYLKSHFEEYDVILANQNRTTIPVYWATKFKKDFTKNWYYIQAYESEMYNTFRLKDLIKRRIADRSYKLPFKKIVNSDIYKNFKLVHTDRVVYPGLDLVNYYHKDIEEFHDIIKIGTIGRIEPFKGTVDVCKAMELLKAEGIEFEYYIAFNDYETIGHHFVRPDGDENLAAFYRDMDIVVAACKGQLGGIHYPVIETMAVGTTIICTDYYPSNNSNSYKVAESAPEQIAEAVKRIIANKKEAIQKRKQALNDVQQFNWSVVAEKFMKYLQDNGECSK